MQQHKVISTGRRLYDQHNQIELRRHQMAISNIQKHKHVFLMIEEDLQALDEKEEITIKPLPEKTYYDNGKVRVTVQACDKAFQDRICFALIRRNYGDTDDSTGDVRILQRDNIIFVVTTTPQKKSCSSNCSVCKCNR